MPWNFGVYNEGLNSLDEQEAFVETVWLTKHEVWRRVRHLPGAEKLYERILGNATKETGASQPSSFMHQVLSTAVLNTSLSNNTQPQPGGIVQLSNDPNFSTLARKWRPSCSRCTSCGEERRPGEWLHDDLHHRAGHPDLSDREYASDQPVHRAQQIQFRATGNVGGSAVHEHLRQLCAGLFLEPLGNRRSDGVAGVADGAP
jgi:hypothetical protein